MLIRVQEEPQLQSKRSTTDISKCALLAKQAVVFIKQQHQPNAEHNTFTA